MNSSTFGDNNRENVDSAWYWSPGWQAAEHEAEDDLAAGRYADFNSLDEMIADLESISG